MLTKFYLVVGAVFLLAFLASCAVSRFSDPSPASTPTPSLTNTSSTPTPIPLPANTPTSEPPPASLPPSVSVSTPGPTPRLTATPYVPPASPLTTSRTQTTAPSAPSSTSVPKSSPTYPGDEPLGFTDIEHWIVVLVNEERAKAGVPALVPNPDIADIARAHSENMHRQGRTSNTLEGKGSKDRARAAGYDYCTGFVGNVMKYPRIKRFRQTKSYGITIGEAAEYGADSRTAALEIVREWMGGPSRENILKSKYRSTGVGVHIDVDVKQGWAWETVYATQNFSGCRR